MKKFLLFAFTFLSIQFANSQTLKVENLNLNAGGVVHDVVFDTYSNAYIVVGNFTSIQGVPRNNLAMIDATTFIVKAETPVTSINGAIRTVELVRKFNTFPTPNRNYLYLGGEFTSVNGQTRNYLCLLQKPEPTSPPFNSSYNITMIWDAEITDVGNPTHAVSDFVLKGDTLTAVGKFEIYSGFASYADYDFGTILSFRPKIDTLDDIPHFETFAQTALYDEQYEIDYFNGNYYLAGGLGFKRFDNSGANPFNFQNCSTGSSYAFGIHVSSSDTLILSRVKYTTGEGISVYQLDGTMLNCPFNNMISPILMNGAISANGFIDTYKDQVFVAENDELLCYQRNGTVQQQPLQSFAANFNWYSYVGSGWRSRKLNVSGDKLFMSGNNFSTLDGSPRVGLVAFCLPPHDAKDFTIFDTLVCQNELKTYRIPPVQFATGYQWTYTGAGAQYRISNTSDPLQALTTNIIAATNANSIDIFYPLGSAGGTLTVTPFSTCNSPTDYQFSDAKSLNINVVPIPEITMADSTFLNCYSDTAWITFTSSTPNVIPYIYRGFDTTWNDSLALDTSMLLSAGYYYGIVTEPINQCASKDSTFFDFDLAPPTVSSNDIVSNPPMFGCNTTSMDIELSLAGTSTQWYHATDTFNLMPNPFTIYSTDSTIFTAVVTQISNGCTATQPFVVQTNFVYANETVLGYPNFPAIPLDSLDCNSPALTMECGVNPPTDGTASWLVGNTPTGSTFINLSEADTTGLQGNYKVYRFITTHNLSGCIDTANVVVQFDFDLPFVATHGVNETINCSMDSAIMVHQNAGNPIEGWLDSFGAQTNSDTLIVQNAGTYYYQAQNDKGCLNTDTVTVSQSMDMSVYLPADTLICPNQTISVLANPVINTGETPTYLWSNGATTNSANAVGGVDSELSVIVQTNSGCIGYDTTLVLITPPITAQLSSGAGCTSAVINVDTISGGSGNYEFSLDGINWQTTPAFSGLTVGSYDIFIKDDLGCVYDFNETIDPSQSGLALNFLAPTYNDLYDTTVAVNFGSFAGFDSTNWALPQGAYIAFESDSLVAFSMGTEGWYDIVLIGYLDTCQFSHSQSVYFGDKPNYQDSTTILGIQSMIVYPNPTTGTFTLDVTMGKIQNYTILVSSLAAQPIASMSTSGVAMTVSESFTFPFGTTPGAYVIHFISDYDARQLTLILN